MNVKGFDPYISVYISNPDQDLPFKDLSFQYFDQPSMHVGTLYPGNAKNIGNLSVPEESTTLISTVRYNGTESIEVDFILNVQPDFSVKVDTKYLRHNVEFIPGWQRRLEKEKGEPYKPDTSAHFDPTIHQN